MTISTRLKATILHALEVIAEEERYSSCTREQWGFNSCIFVDLLRAVDPQAKSKHLSMYEVWRDEHKALGVQMEVLKDLEEVNTVFLQNQNKPVLPDYEIELLNREFRKLDVLNNGYITLHDIIRAWGWSYDLAYDTVAAYNIAGDGHLTHDEYLRMMCPEEYRLPEMSGVALEMFGQLLSSEISSRHHSMDHDAAVFCDASISDDISLAKEAPHAVLRVVEKHVYDRWERVFVNLDKNSDGKVQPEELLASGLLSKEVCLTIVKLIGSESEGGFTRKAFMDALLKTHELRAP